MPKGSAIPSFSRLRSVFNIVRDATVLSLPLLLMWRYHDSKRVDKVEKRLEQIEKRSEEEKKREPDVEEYFNSAIIEDDSSTDELEDGKSKVAAPVPAESDKSGAIEPELERKVEEPMSHQDQVDFYQSPGYITGIKVSNGHTLRNIKKLEWNDVPMLSVLTGPNGSGKTAILEAISVSYLGERHNPSRNVSVQFNKAIEGNTTHVSYYTPLNSNFLTSNAREYESFLEELKKDILNYVRRKLTMKKISEIAFKGYSELYDRVGTRYLSESDVPENMLEKVGLEIVLRQLIDREFLDYFGPKADSYVDPNEYVKNLINMGETIDAINDYLTGVKSKYIIFKKKTERNMVKTAAGQVVRNMSVMLFDTVTVDDFKKERNYSTLSPGEKIEFLSYLWGYSSAFIKDGSQLSPRILLLDEPDAGVHASLVNDLIKVITEKLVLQHKMQVIMVTHNSSTISMLPEGVSIYDVKDNDSELIVTKASSKAEVIRRLTLDGVFVEAPFRLVFTEAPSDVSFYEAMHTQIYRANGLNRPKVRVSFVSYAKNSKKGDDQKNACRKQVEDLVNQLLTANSEGMSLDNFIYGFVDNDNRNEDNKSLGRNIHTFDRYSFENYLYDPVYLYFYAASLGENRSLKIYQNTLLALRNKNLPTPQRFEDILGLDKVNVLKIIQEIIDVFSQSIEVHYQRLRVKGVKLDPPLKVVNHLKNFMPRIIEEEKSGKSRLRQALSPDHELLRCDKLKSEVMLPFKGSQHETIEVSYPEFFFRLQGHFLAEICCYFFNEKSESAFTNKLLEFVRYSSENGVLPMHMDMYRKIANLNGTECSSLMNASLPESLAQKNRTLQEENKNNLKQNSKVIDEIVKKLAKSSSEEYQKSLCEFAKLYPEINNKKKVKKYHTLGKEFLQRMKENQPFGKQKQKYDALNHNPGLVMLVGEIYKLDGLYSAFKEFGERGNIKKLNDKHKSLPAKKLTEEVKEDEISGDAKINAYYIGDFVLFLVILGASCWIEKDSESFAELMEERGGQVALLVIISIAALVFRTCCCVRQFREPSQHLNEKKDKNKELLKTFIKKLKSKCSQESQNNFSSQLSGSSVELNDLSESQVHSLCSAAKLGNERFSVASKRIIKSFSDSTHKAAKITKKNHEDTLQNADVHNVGDLFVAALEKKDVERTEEEKKSLDEWLTSNTMSALSTALENLFPGVVSVGQAVRRSNDSLSFSKEDFQYPETTKFLFILHSNGNHWMVDFFDLRDPNNNVQFNPSGESCRCGERALMFCFAKAFYCFKDDPVCKWDGKFGKHDFASLSEEQLMSTLKKPSLNAIEFKSNPIRENFIDFVEDYILPNKRHETSKHISKSVESFMLFVDSFVKKDKEKQSASSNSVFRGSKKPDPEVRRDVVNTL